MQQTYYFVIQLSHCSFFLWHLKSFKLVKDKLVNDQDQEAWTEPLYNQQEIYLNNALM